jgi:hypothetical protein
VVTSAQFLVDSETNLMAAMQAMSMTMPGMDMSGMDMSAPGAMDHSQHTPGAMDHSQHVHAGSSAGSGSASMPGMPGM